MSVQKNSRQRIHLHVQTPQLDSIDMTMSLGNRTERLLDGEYLLLEQLIAYKEQSVNSASLKDTLGLEFAAPDRILNKAMMQLIRKTNALFPAFPLIRKLTRDQWIYTEVAPKRKPLGAVRGS